MTYSEAAKKITNKIWLSREQAEALAADIDAAMADQSERVSELEKALQIYAESVDENKEWCTFKDSACSTKWFHSVAGPGAARAALKSTHDSKVGTTVCRHGKPTDQWCEDCDEGRK